MTVLLPPVDVSNPSLDHLRARLELLMMRVETAVAFRRVTDPDPEDRFRGLYVADHIVDDLLQARRPSLGDARSDDLSRDIEAAADGWQASGARLRLRQLANDFDLELVDIDILLTAMAPDLDPRFERLYGYLHDDVTRRRASIGLALELCGLDPAGGDGRARLAASSALVLHGLVVLEEGERPLLTRPLRVPDRVSAHLLGVDFPDPVVADLLMGLPTAMGAEWAPLDTALEQQISPIYLREPPGASAVSVAVAALDRIVRPAVPVNLTQLAANSDPDAAAAAVVREARLRGGTLIAGPVDALVDRAPGVISLLAQRAGNAVLVGTRAWDPDWARRIPLTLDLPQPTGAQRAAEWAAALNGHGVEAEMERATLAFRLTPTQVARAAEGAELYARAHRRAVEVSDVQAGARAQNAAGLDRLAHRVEPHAQWGDLVLPPAVRTQLAEVAARARQRDRVYDEWRLGGRATRGRGITALFAGDSGTGKTLSAEVITAELGLDLYVIDLSTVVDKYIGETEKNLDRIFNEADRVDGVLLFDEADAIFGKRSEVRDARDRYANVEVAYLLQRMERFDGLAVLTTNLRANLDDSFTRRIDVIVDFPMPDESDRLALWRIHLPAPLPRADDLDLAFLASRFQLSGGNIRNICLTAAFFAADADRPLEMSDLIRATEREYRKLGRLTVEAEFGEYLDLLRTTNVHG